MPSRRSSLSLNQRLTLIIAVLALVATIIVAFISGHDWFPSNEKPTIIQVSAKSISGGDLPKSRDRSIICRDQLQFFNSSNIPTSLISMSMDLHVDGELMEFHVSEESLIVQNNHNTVVVTVWGSNPPDFMQYINATSFNEAISLLGERLPIPVKEHSITEVFVDILVQYDGLKPYEVIASYILEFPDIDAVSLPRTDCIGV
jgi:hypothetical protein